jgi:hypothetical protein
LDNVQFTKRDWRTRNQILTPQGLAWINIPIVKPDMSNQNINQIHIRDFDFIKDHLELIKRNYTRAACFQENWEWISTMYDRAISGNLSEFNINLIKNISLKLNCNTTFYSSIHFQNAEDATQRLLNICHDLGATKYLTGPNAKEYLDVSRFREEGIDVIWANYDFEEYPQLWVKTFEPKVSIIDAILNVGLSKDLLKKSGSELNEF